MNKSLIVQISVGMLFLVFAGCSLQTTVPAVSKYSLDVTPNIKEVKNSPYRDKVIRMGVLESLPSLSGTTIYYTTDSAESYSYTKSRWNESVSIQLERLLNRSLSKSKMFKDVVPFRSLANNDLIFEINIYEMTQVVHDDGTSTMGLGIKLRVVEQYSRKIIATELFEKEITEEEGNVKGALKGYNSLVSDLLVETQTWLKQLAEITPTQP